jgi:hypothetical protein
MTQEVVWEPQPGPQTSLLRCPCFEVFFGGARGGGKTDAVLGDFISHADKYGVNAIGLMVRRTRTELVETVERSRALYLPLGAKFNDTDKMWRFPNGARLRFAYLERDADADSYQGHSYSRIYIEEAGTFPSINPILKLMATLRSGAGVPVGMRLTGNPGGPGQNWVKARYIDPAPEGYKIFNRDFINPLTGQELSTDWVFIPSRVSDNKLLMERDPMYIARIMQSGSEKLVKAWLEGDFSSVEGAYFDNWDYSKHVVAPFFIPEDWIRFRSMDWGSAAPFSVGWWAVAGDDTVVPVIGTARDDDGNGRSIRIPRGCLVRYREWYGCVPGQANKGLKLTAEEIADGIRQRETGEHIRYGVLDPSAFKEDGGPSFAERMQKQAGIKFRPADNKRVSRGANVGTGPLAGWDQMRARLNGNADGDPMIVTFNTCLASIRTIPVLQHDKDKPEDLDTEGEDHAADEWRYACMSRPFISKKATPVREGFKDYIRKHIGPAAGDWMSY